MKNLVFTALALAAVMGASAFKKSKRPPLTPEQQVRLRTVRQRQTGGFLTVKGQGHLAILNGQDAVPETVVHESIAPMLSFVRGLKVEVKPAAFTLATAKAVRLKSGAAACVFLTDDPSLPMSLVALEEGWGVVNVAPLREGNPDAAKLALRFRKELVRITSVVFSGVRSQYRISPLQGVTSIADLDRTPGDQYGVDTLMAIARNLPDIGVTPDRMITYREACRQGIAPTPTNNFQKVIWEQMKAEKERGPSKPITIPPPKK